MAMIQPTGKFVLVTIVCILLRGATADPQEQRDDPSMSMRSLARDTDGGPPDAASIATRSAFVRRVDELLQKCHASRHADLVTLANGEVKRTVMVPDALTDQGSGKLGLTVFLTIGPGPSAAKAATNQLVAMRVSGLLSRINAMYISGDDFNREREREAFDTMNGITAGWRKSAEVADQPWLHLIPALKAPDVVAKLRLVPKEIRRWYNARNKSFEFPALEAAWSFCGRVQRPSAILYLHTKSSTLSSSDFHHPGPTGWRLILTHYGAGADFESCVRNLEHGYATCGPLLTWGARVDGKPEKKSKQALWPHYSGNFFWARCDYVRGLPNPRPDEADLKPANNRADANLGLQHPRGRWRAEAWILDSSHQHTTPKFHRNCWGGGWGKRSDSGGKRYKLWIKCQSTWIGAQHMPKCTTLNFARVNEYDIDAAMPRLGRASLGESVALRRRLFEEQSVDAMLAIIAKRSEGAPIDASKPPIDLLSRNTALGPSSLFHGVGGAEENLLFLSVALRARGHDVRVHLRRAGDRPGQHNEYDLLCHGERGSPRCDWLDPDLGNTLARGSGEGSTLPSGWAVDADTGAHSFAGAEWVQPEAFRRVPGAGGGAHAHASAERARMRRRVVVHQRYCEHEGEGEVLARAELLLAHDWFSKFNACLLPPRPRAGKAGRRPACSCDAVVLHSHTHRMLNIFWSRAPFTPTDPLPPRRLVPSVNGIAPWTLPPLPEQGAGAWGRRPGADAGADADVPIAMRPFVRQHGKAVFANSADRGLAPLLRLWPEIVRRAVARGAREDELELHIFGITPWFVRHNRATANNDFPVAETLRTIKALLRKLWQRRYRVVAHGQANHTAITRHFATAGTFPFCGLHLLGFLSDCDRFFSRCCPPTQGRGCTRAGTPTTRRSRASAR